MPVIGIDQVNFWAESATVADHYLRDWGLTHFSDAFGTRYECMDGSAVTFEEKSVHDIARLPFRNLEELVWGTVDQSSLDRIASDLARDRSVRIDEEGTAHTIDDIRLSIGLRVSRRRSLDPKPILFNTPGAPSRIDQAATFYDRAVPQEISHIVLGVSQLHAGEKFYRERMGFHLSDRYIGRGVFLRGPAIGTHRNLFMLDDGKTVFNHLAFKVRDIHEVIGGGQGFSRTGAQTLTGPGRHFASSGCFWYFKSPFGGAMEYVADEDILTPAWKPSEYIPSPERFSEWVFHTDDEMGSLKKA